MKFVQCGWMPGAAMILLSGVCLANPRTDVVEFNIPAQALEKSLRDFHSQAPNVFLLVPAEIETTAKAPVVRGRLTPEVALTRLLRKSGVTLTFVPPGTFTLHVEHRLEGPASPEGSSAIPEIFVTGSRTLNTDQLRTEGDAFAYTIFDAEKISYSTAADAREFLASELPAYSSRGVSLGASAVSGASGQITVRGLPSSETVILFDGHRRAGIFAGGYMQQPDVSMVPLSSLARMEVRTASASALYGSDAVVGSINFIRDRKTPRTQFFLRAEELTVFSSGTQQFSAEHVQKLGQGRGWLALDVAFRRQEDVALGERNFLTAGRQRTAVHYPRAYADAPAPSLGLLRNVHATGTSTFPINGGTRFLYLPAGFQAGDDLSRLTETAGKYSFELAPSAQALGEFSMVRPSRRIYSVSAAAGWEFTKALSADLDAGYAESSREGHVSALDVLTGQAFFVPASHPANPLHQDLWATSGTAIADGTLSRRDQSVYVTLGTQWRLSEVMMARLDHAWSAASTGIRQPVLQGNLSGLTPLLMDDPPQPYSLGDLGMALGEQSSPRFTNALEETTLRWTHSHLTVFPAGPTSVTVSAQRRYEKTAEEVLREPDLSRTAVQRAQRTLSLAASASVPLVEARDQNGRERLALDLGLRRDAVVIQPAPEAVEQRTLRFASVSAAAGLRWQMLESLGVRLQCTTGFLPPPLSSLSGKSEAFLQDLHLTDPERGGEPLEAALVIAGGNYDLRRERSRACGGGVVLQNVEDEWRLSMDYTRLVKSDVVLTPADLFFANPQNYLTDYAWRVRRDGPGGPIVAIETWSLNIARQKVESVDIRFNWRAPLFSGEVGVSFFGSAQPVSTHRLAGSIPRENDAGVGNLASPVWRGVTTATWERGGFALGVTARHTSSYDVSRVEAIRLCQGNENVASQTYVDLFSMYTLPGRFFGGASAQVSFSARNVLHRDPPVDLGETGYASRFGLEEFSSLSLSLNVRF
jgi:outer membrane receptor protein involved in Fe transport